jgi:hypothetical protein
MGGKKLSVESVTRLEFVTDWIHVHPTYVFVFSVSAAVIFPVKSYALCQREGGKVVQITGTQWFGRGPGTNNLPYVLIE